MKIFHKVITYIFVFLLAVAMLTGLLVLSAMLPRAAIQENMLESAEFLQEGALFGEAVAGVNGSKIDRYADSILLAIAYQYDSRHPLQSVMLSSYYYTPYQNENENLLDAVTGGYPPNQQYLRYWHGSNAIVRPLLLVFNLRQIYGFHGIVLAGLVLYLLGILLRKKAYVPAIGIGLGLVLTASWFVPLSLEYTWSYLVMLAVSIIGVKLAYSGRWNGMGILFLLSGMVTNYLDFLTTETLTLLVPLLLVLWIDIHENQPQTVTPALRKTGKAMLLWMTGYVGMWLMKWLLAAVILQENVMPYVAGHIQERIGGDIGLSLWRYVTGAVLRNVKCLFPLEYGVVGRLAALGILIFASYVGYVYHKKQINKGRVLLYLAIGLVPYIRYMVFHNHAYLHCFFTYRAQMAAIVALVWILEELTEWRWQGPWKCWKKKALNCPWSCRA